MRLLIVEDDNIVAELLNRGLVAEGHTVTLIHNGPQALQTLKEHQYDAAILDVMLPGLSGAEVAKRFRLAGGRTPILMLTARDALPDRLAGFEAGADDYVVKPFALQELSARLKALGRRAGSAADHERLVVGELIVDLRAHEATRAGKTLVLTPREFALLAYLARHEGKTLSRSMILDGVWGNSVDAYGNVVDATIRRLRKSLDEGFDRPLIHTVRGVGYKLRV
ncbi:MAG TPA: response regulator transcription factor [Chloroflexota bacterium]|jgi:two-component system OmpR family response regulator|nr:response regulator transcription factor [Chloroflexota bacterium]